MGPNMKKSGKRPTFSDVRDQFDYDEDTGWLIRKNLRARNQRIEAGSPNDRGMLVVGLNGTHELAHRLVWLWVHGEWPPKQIEHINGDKTDNRISNLKLRNPSAKFPLTIERLNWVLRYEREQGKFYWSKPNKGILVGDEAGSINPNGYRTIMIDQKAHYAHRLVWFIEAGTWPKDIVDHINGDRDDNRIVNLRDVTSSRNSHNTWKLGNNNKTGFRGVTRAGGKYIPQIMVDGVLEFIGYTMFDTAEEAAKVYEARRLELFGEAAHQCEKVYSRPSRAKGS